jgi:uncharacterized protein (TIGR02145 family)
MTKIVFQNSKILTLSGNWIIPVAGIGPLPMYTITIGTSTHGSVSASSMTASEGTTITLTATPDTDYQLDYFTMNGIAIVGNSFVMPNADVTVSAVFVAAAPTFDTVTIGSQTWMSKNLAFDDGQSGIYTQTVNYGQGSVTEYYYTWEAAVRIAASIDGWHLPTWDECDTLCTTVGSPSGTKLKSTYGWSSGNGTDNYGFTALPSGVYYQGTFYDFSTWTSFWTSSKSTDISQAYTLGFDTGTTRIGGSYDVTAGCSVRLIKDA